MDQREKIDRARYISTTGKVIWERIIRIQAEHLSRSCRAEAFGELSMHQFNTVLMVQRHGPLTITGLAGLLGVSPPSASNMVERLVEKGILLREPSPEDRRKVLISVSPEMVEEIQQVESTVLQLFVDLVDRLGPETILKWCEVLGTVKEAVEAETTETDRQRDAVSRRSGAGE